MLMRGSWRVAMVIVIYLIPRSSVDNAILKIASVCHQW